MTTFILIGHCGPDSHLLKRAIARAVPGASVVFANDEAALKLHQQSESVLLVNRALEDGDFDCDSGVELIQRIRESNPAPVAMLVSNYAEAQEKARSVGAIQGFGKNDVNSGRTADLLRAAAKAAARPAAHSSGSPD